jgi:hypothetical protein
MNLNQPRVITWWIALILAVLAAIGAIFNAGFLSTFDVWFALVSAVLLLLATVLKGL